ncbi:MFS transporter [Rugosimonospora africana]|uniref:MFS transporter n=1 Tax=Rugosimonospora africana TaxID=556532 RepID=A0A8J3QVT0_9ACTN|nr:MFS transporter [Rugosimonospora africana]GIH17763.1 MFS transporter [Rugosimonospora africana]
MPLLIDTSPLRESPQFRRLWTGYAVNQLGSQLTVVAVAYQIYRLTGSSLDVGLISLAQIIPAIIGPILGGSIADAIDRRTVLFYTNVGGAVCTLALAVNASLPHPAIWPLYVLAALAAGFAGADNPTRTAMMISLVDRNSIVAANALRTLLQQIAYVIGPATGGLLLAAFGIGTVFWVDVATFAVALVAVASLEPHPPHGGGTRFGLQSVLDGFRFLRNRQAIQGCFVADLNATILGMPSSLFPALGVQFFHGGADAVGYLYAAPGAGAFLGALFSGWIPRIHRQGRTIIIAIAIWGVAIAAFGFVHVLWLGLILLAVAGGADVVSAVGRSSILQQEVTDGLRGRLASIQTAVVQVGPRLGNGEAGLAASLGGAQFSVVSGGIGCVVGIAIITVLMPRFARYVKPVVEDRVAADVV